MNEIRDYSTSTKCIHAGNKQDPLGALVTPIYQTSTFKFRDCDHGARLFAGEEDGYIYTRMRNPTVEAMEDAIAILEGGAAALGCGSGMAAVSTLFTAVLSAGDHIVCSESVYGPTMTILQNIFSRFAVESSFVDTSIPENVAKAMRPNTKFVFVETPGNPTLVMSDIAAIAEIAHKHGAKMGVDNTFMSPVLQSPFKHGADYIIHSLTKFLNGHADVVGGVIIVKEAADYPAFRKVLNQMGGTIDPFNAFLVHRGIKTLQLRMERHCANAQIIAEFLQNHPKIEWVNYPGLPSHPQYYLTAKQMEGAGGMIAFELKGGLEAGKTLLNNIKIWQLAVSLGGIESLVQHPASMTHNSMGAVARRQAGIGEGLVRISVGIEDAGELLKALSDALDTI